MILFITTQDGEEFRLDEGSRPAFSTGFSGPFHDVKVTSLLRALDAYPRGVLRFEEEAFLPKTEEEAEALARHLEGEAEAWEDPPDTPLEPVEHLVRISAISTIRPMPS